MPNIHQAHSLGPPWKRHGLLLSELMHGSFFLACFASPLQLRAAFLTWQQSLVRHAVVV